jgi:hypothetical protein
LYALLAQEGFLVILINLSACDAFVFEHLQLINYRHFATHVLSPDLSIWEWEGLRANLTPLSNDDM